MMMTTTTAMARNDCEGIVGMSGAVAMTLADASRRCVCLEVKVDLNV